MKKRRVPELLIFAGIFLSAMVCGRAQTTVHSPITVPLHFTPTNAGADKLGIWVGIGSGATPQLFEFDTGGTGFYAAYSPVSGVSPWWGGGVTVNASQQIHTAYDSGLNYFGNVAQGAVSIFASGNSTTPSVITAPTTLEAAITAETLAAQPKTRSSSAAHCPARRATPAIMRCPSW